jgi:hypothetical protein
MIKSNGGEIRGLWIFDGGGLGNGLGGVRCCATVFFEGSTPSLDEDARSSTAEDDALRAVERFAVDARASTLGGTVVGVEERGGAEVAGAGTGSITGVTATALAGSSSGGGESP